MVLQCNTATSLRLNCIPVPHAVSGSWARTATPAAAPADQLVSHADAGSCASLSAPCAFSATTALQPCLALNAARHGRQSRGTPKTAQSDGSLWIWTCLLLCDVIVKGRKIQCLLHGTVKRTLCIKCTRMAGNFTMLHTSAHKWWDLPDGFCILLRVWTCFLRLAIAADQSLTLLSDLQTPPLNSRCLSWLSSPLGKISLVAQQQTGPLPDPAKRHFIQKT